MAASSDRHDAEDIEEQFQVIREDIATLTRLLKEVGESRAGDTRDAALSEATELLEKSRRALEEGRDRARAGAAPVEHYINEKPMQSALIALGVGFLVGLMSRR